MSFKRKTKFTFVTVFFLLVISVFMIRKHVFKCLNKKNTYKRIYVYTRMIFPM